MANEKANKVETKAMEQANETKSTPQLFVTRETYISRKDNQEYWCYVLKGKICRTVKGKVFEQEVKVNFVAKDQGGYEVLDMIFFNTDTAELRIRDESMTNERTGEVTAYKVYEVVSRDDFGVELTYKVKLQRESDKSLLDAVIKTMLGGGNVATQG